MDFIASRWEVIPEFELAAGVSRKGWTSQDHRAVLVGDWLSSDPLTGTREDHSLSGHLGRVGIAAV